MMDTALDPQFDLLCSPLPCLNTTSIVPKSSPYPTTMDNIRQGARLLKQEAKEVPTIDTFGCARFHPFGNGKPQKRAGLPPGSGASREDARRHPFPSA